MKPFVTHFLPFYQELARTGVIRLYQHTDGQWSSDGSVYELTLP